MYLTEVFVLFSQAFLPLAVLGMLVFVNGWTDAPNAITCPVVTGCLSKEKAVLMAGIMNLVGCASTCVIGGKVADVTLSLASFGDGIGAMKALCVGILSVVIWSIFAWFFGIPTSESHGMLASLSGAAAAYAIKSGGYIRGAVSGGAWRNILIGLVVSTLPAFAVAGLLSALFARRDKKRIRSRDGFYTKAQIFGAAATSFMHGAEDGQKFVGICFMILSVLGISYHSYTLPIAASVALVMTLGTLCGGGRIIEHTGRDMANLDKRAGFCADLSASAVLLLCVAFGLPVSTTHAKTCAIMGAGKGVNKSIVGEMLLAWILTFPVCALLGFVGVMLF